MISNHFFKQDPKLLKNIHGHKELLNTLLNAVEKKLLHHALLFTGPSGVGRKKSAFAIAQNLLCEKQHPACGQCISCSQVVAKKNQNILYIEPDGLHIKVDQIRSISQFLALQSFASARVIIIDSAQQMNIQAANSLLKVLEEPPKNVYFILITSHLSTLPITIRSRTQIIHFKPLKTEDIKNIIKKNNNIQKTKEKLKQHKKNYTTKEEIKQQKKITPPKKKRTTNKTTIKKKKYLMKAQ